MGTKKARNYPDLEVIKQDAQPEVKDSERVTDLIHTVNIETDKTLEMAVTMVAEIKQKYEEVDSKRKTWVDPLNAVVTDINAFFKPALQALKDAESLIKAKIQGYVEGNMAKRDRLLEACSGATPDEKAVLLRSADELVPQKVPGMSIREGWKGEVADREALLAWIIQERRFEYLSINEAALTALTKEAGQDPGIPGWLAKPARSVVITPSRVKK